MAPVTNMRYDPILKLDIGTLIYFTLIFEEEKIHFVHSLRYKYRISKKEAIKKGKIVKKKNDYFYFYFFMVKKRGSAKLIHVNVEKSLQTLCNRWGKVPKSSLLAL